MKIKISEKLAKEQIQNLQCCSKSNKNVKLALIDRQIGGKDISDGYEKGLELRVLDGIISTKYLFSEKLHKANTAKMLA